MVSQKSTVSGEIWNVISIKMFKKKRHEETLLYIFPPARISVSANLASANVNSFFFFFVEATSFPVHDFSNNCNRPLRLLISHHNDDTKNINMHGRCVFFPPLLFFFPLISGKATIFPLIGRKGEREAQSTKKKRKKI